MDSLARTSLKPIRCTERETASPSSVMLYVRIVVGAALYSCTLLFLCLPLPALSRANRPFLSVPPSARFHHPLPPLSLLCVYTPSSHMYCYLVVQVQDVMFCGTANKRQKSPLGQLGSEAATNFNCFLLHQIPWCFIIQCKVMAKMVNWLFCVRCSLFCTVST